MNDDKNGCGVKEGGVLYFSPSKKNAIYEYTAPTNDWCFSYTVLVVALAKGC